MEKASKREFIYWICKRMWVILETFFKQILLVPFSVISISLLVFLIFVKRWNIHLYTYVALHNKFGCSILCFGDVIIRRLHTTHVCIDKIPKTSFLDSGNLKTYKSGENSISKILTLYNSFIKCCNLVVVEIMYP